MEFRTKQQLALKLIDHALGNGVRVAAWTFDEAYGRDGQFLDALHERGQVFVGEVPVNFHGWVQKPPSGDCRRQNRGGRRQPRRRRGCEVQNLLKYSPILTRQGWQRYRIKDTDKGPEVWEVKWAVFWRKEKNALPGRRHCLLVARNVLTGQVKYFVANRVPGEAGIPLRWLLRVAFGRSAVEQCFREAKADLGMDHYQVRGWRCLHRHFYLTQLSHLFCARVRQEYDDPAGTGLGRLTVQQVRSAVNAWLTAAAFTPAARQEHFDKELDTQQYHQRRNHQARQSHTKTRLAKLKALGIDVTRIKSCLPQSSNSTR